MDLDDERGWTLLHISCCKGDLEQVRRLLDEGQMDVNVAAWGRKSKGITPLHLAAEGGHLEVMDELLESGANVDARTKVGACGWTLLHSAAKERRREALNFLVENESSLPDDIDDFSLECAYKDVEEMKSLQSQSASSGESSGSCSPEC